MQLMERDGNLCQGMVDGKRCLHQFKSIDEIRVNHKDGNERNNPQDLSNYDLLCNACNYHHWLELQKREVTQDHDNQPARQEPVCVPVPEMEIEHVVRTASECWNVRPKVVKPVKQYVHSIIPRNRSELDDTEDSNTSSESRSDSNHPKYCLYFMLRAKLGYRFRATEAKRTFALNLNIRHGTIKNHYYSTMSEYFERDEEGYFMDVRKWDARAFFEEREIEHLIHACRVGTIRESQNWQLMTLYADVLQISTEELLEMFMDAPVMDKQA